MMVVLLLLLTVPVKAAFATGMLWCGPSHADAALSAVAPLSDPAHSPSEGAHAGHHGSVEYPSTPGDGAATGGAFGQHGDVTCALCAACCVGGVCLNTLPLDLSLPEPGDPAFPPLSSRFLGFLPDRLERPPPRILV
jgi:hypothetical protein